MASYLNIYLQKKKKEGEENGERLLLCSISRSDMIYSLFYDNSIGIIDENNFHEFTVNDFDNVLKTIDNDISDTIIRLQNLKEALPLIHEKDSIDEILEQISSDKEYFQELMNQKYAMNALHTLFADITEEWCDFDKLYWKIS